MRRAAFTAVVLLVIALCVSLVTVSAATTGAATPTAQKATDRLSTLTTTVRNADVRELLTNVFAAMKVDSLITDDVVGKIDLSVRNATPEDILERVCAAKGLHWWTQGTMYVVSAKDAPTTTPKPGAAPSVVAQQPSAVMKQRTYPCTYMRSCDIASLFNHDVVPGPEGRVWQLQMSGLFGRAAKEQALANTPGHVTDSSLDPFADPSLKPYSNGSDGLGQSKQFGMGMGMGGGGLGFGGLQQGGGVSVNQTGRIGTGRIGTGTRGLGNLGNQPLTEREQEMLESGIDITAPFAALLPAGMTAPVAYEPLNYLIFEATDEAYDRFLELVRIFDQKPKQVLLEVQFVTMNTIDAFALGLDWFWNTGRTGISVTGLNPGGFVSLKFAKGREFAANLSTLLTNNKARLVNAPRIATMNNFPANINFTQYIPYVNFTGATVVPNGGAIGGGATVETVEIPTTLDILPRINGDDSVTVLLNPQISSFSLIEVPIPGGGTQQYPQTSTQSLYTLLNIKNEETMVIGGFIARTEVNNSSRVPLLGDLPLIGQLFRSVNRSTNDSELLIFVTPHVMKDEFTAGTNMTF